jgi:hypothetical protein
LGILGTVVKNSIKNPISRNFAISALIQVWYIIFLEFELVQCTLQHHLSVTKNNSWGKKYVGIVKLPYYHDHDDPLKLMKTHKTKNVWGKRLHRHREPILTLVLRSRLILTLYFLLGYRVFIWNFHRHLFNLTTTVPLNPDRYILWYCVFYGTV